LDAVIIVRRFRLRLTKVFLPKKPDSLEKLEKSTWFGSKATSLRMSDAWLSRNKAQSDLSVCYNEVDTVHQYRQKAVANTIISANKTLV